MSYPDQVLNAVQKPARYTGGEWNAVKKDFSRTLVKSVLAFPDIYEVGMANLSLPILYDIINRRPDALAERVYMPWPDMAAAIRENELALLSLENQRPVRDFDVIGFSLGAELSYTTVLEMLDLAGLPVWAAARDNTCPLVIAGGTSAFNPEPMAAFIDAFFVGDAEDSITEFLDVLGEWQSGGKAGGRAALLEKLAGIEGVYIPSLYRADYHDDGTLAALVPESPAAPAVINRRIIRELPPPVTKPVVPYLEAVQDRGVIEISRGCVRGCRFCHAGTVYRPSRQRPHQEVLEAADAIIHNCGYDEISLLSLSTSDYEGIETLVAELGERYRGRHLAISLPSLRVTPGSVSLVESLPEKRRSGLTFAPEAASPRLGRVINKVIPEEELLTTAAAAFNRGWTTLKLYYMLGLPTETMEDLSAMAETLHRVYNLGRTSPGRRPSLRVSLATFIPKAHTPFQWVAQDDEDTVTAKQHHLLGLVKNKGIRLSWSDTKMSLLEAALSRGDRRISAVIYAAWQRGSTLDGWSEFFDWGRWAEAFTETGLDPDFYARRTRSLEELLPWSHIDIGVSPGHLKREYRRALAAEATGDCHDGSCLACGLHEVVPACQETLARRGGE
ncbi:MAG: TIGR03960 family B12-binding radical SAM protein [Dehalogenimonas sp.]|uniref:TIGR03960 family B12-binding radical SAM protein n=1 Tax=Candidatus Dehalogenimonas loeffleri TaxID=3127115 RepID=A0ABZ2J561_9CHLR|nr:TIGR03960 family B12-binding radical SAM protein [Dehalogenimonas sp.]